MNTEDINALFQYAETLGFGEVHIKFDPATGLRAIIALHSTKNGPALGGTRCIEYAGAGEAMRDALRLARGMSYKAAISNLAFGGGKSVVIKPAQLIDRQAYFQSFGRFVNQLGGRYIAAMDSGTSVADMDAINTTTNYVASSSKLNGDPSPYTANGIIRGMEAAAQFKLGKSSLDNLTVAIQGVGNVGYEVAKRLHAKGAQLIISDVNSQSAQRCVNEFNAKIMPSHEIHRAACDIFAPCALGAILNEKTIPEIKAKIIAGCANNQLATPQDGERLHARNILYTPDYVINAGGLIYAATYYSARDNITSAVVTEIQNRINNIYDTLLTIFNRARSEDTAISKLVDIMAAERL
jgi:leucine dehydrogenase